MLAIVSHDAGGAEILSSLVSRLNEDWCGVLDGPAVAIFERKLGSFLKAELDDAIAQAEWVLCGTSWKSHIELQAIQACKTLGKRVVCFLDHWVNYQERFRYGDTVILPDEIWVGDQMALELARAAFPSTPVTLVRNPYFDDVEAFFRSVPLTRISGSALYVCEPVGEHALMKYGDANYWGYNEFSALDYFLSRIKDLGDVKNIIVRPHPSEGSNKYSSIIAPLGLTLEVRNGNSLFDEIAQVDLVAGCESMAMVIALLAKRRVICSIPPGGRACQLPHPEIERLQDI